MSRLVKVGTCNLNQWALDFDGNLERIKESIRIAKDQGCRLRLGPELEIPGYGCEDHFLELDTIRHSWECLADLLCSPENLTDDILCDFGLPALHRDVVYNCRVYCLNGQVLAVRPKMYLANDGNYRETRFFTEWHTDGVETFYLPDYFLDRMNQLTDKVHTERVHNVRVTSFQSTTLNSILSKGSTGPGGYERRPSPGTQGRATSGATTVAGDVTATTGSSQQSLLSHHGVNLPGAEALYQRSTGRSASALYTAAGMKEVPPPLLHPSTVPIGIIVLRLRDCVIGSETCEELFTPNSPHITMSLDGVHIITNGSGSHHELRKLRQRVDLIQSATAKSGGIYLYANQLGCDGGRCFYDGCSMIWENGKLVAQGSQFGLEEVEVVTGVVDLSAVSSFRASFKSRSNQASMTTTKYPRVEVDFELGGGSSSTWGFGGLVKSEFRNVRIPDPMEEIAYGPSAWLWDYLRRSGQRGYFLPLSGGMDSSSTAMLVGIMCHRVYELIANGTDPGAGGSSSFTRTTHRAPSKHSPRRDSKALPAGSSGSPGKTSSPPARVPEVPLALRDLRGILKDPMYVPTSGQDICKRLFFTCYMASEFSGAETRRRAKMVSELIGAAHTSIFIDKVTDAVKNVFSEMSVVSMGGEKETKPELDSDMRATTQSNGVAHISSGASTGSSAPTTMLMKTPDINGSGVENIALQNIQARSRMVMSYFLAQLLPWQFSDGRDQWPGQLLVLGSANVDEALRGYYTKYDCSAADINPIGGIRKVDLKQFLLWGDQNYGKPMQNSVLYDTATAEPSAELTGSEGNQKDEDDMGMSYAELAELGQARKCDRGGPYSVFTNLLQRWTEQKRTLTGSKRCPAKDLPAKGGKNSTPGPNAAYADQVGQKVKDFFFYNAINRHKMTTLTPAYHAENYSPEDNRFDLRPFLYPATFSRQFRAIDDAVAALRHKEQRKTAEAREASRGTFVPGGRSTKQ
ncbi:unnamed protein product [Amoebophrya sp. A25]|nr:unnamed protein product [Amoebophrya sp. A25]|eukprot:GSA25T00025999001.1